ncbi:MAG: NADH-ubiquinone oxidoreductase-F iron-sulfur binding region domain-containing protein [Candidatus Methylomirabilales bacterium]
MRRLDSLEALDALRARLAAEAERERGKPCLVLCAGTGGQASGSGTILRLVKRYILEHRLQDRLGLRITGCQGFCQMDPFIVVEPGGHLYPRLRGADVPRVIQAALRGEVAADLCYREPGNGAGPLAQPEIPFFAGQRRLLLGANQRLDPIRIEDALSLGAYEALRRVLARNDPEWVIQEVTRSGLRGRGGAGFPTGRKWALARAAGRAGGTKYLVCNADEGDPGAYMDRSLLEGNPHAILEGLCIGGFAIGATHGLVYVRSEYPLAIKHTLIAIRQARDLGLLGRGVLGTAFDFDVEIVRGAGAFVCGEETALIRSIEGRPGEPRQRPPFPIQRGIGGHPTCINNVETLANIPGIIRDGAEAFRRIGAPGNTGTKIFSLVGKIRHTGLVEVPLGTPIREVVYDIGGGAPGGAAIKAVQTGGPSGGCIPAHRFDLPIDYDSLAAAGTIMGSGGMIVMDETTCMVDVAKYFMNFLRGESCGKCFTCRKGTQRMHELLEDIAAGRATPGHLDLLQELAEAVKDTSLCGLGQSAANPVLSTLRYFRHEYERHIRDKRCDAYACRDLVGAPCQAACPLGTEVWRYVAHIERGEYEEAYRTIRAANPFPSVCARVCHHPCEAHCRAGTGAEPIAIRALKRFVTDRVDPAASIPRASAVPAPDAPRVAVVGAGPAGLAAAHALAGQGCRVTVFEAAAEPGGMLLRGIPAYRLPTDVLRREIRDLLVSPPVRLECGRALGRDFGLDDLLHGGFAAVFLAVGAHRSRRLGLTGEDAAGVYPALEFLARANRGGQALARGAVGVIGGGNAAVDAARVALRQPGVGSVSLLYRRTRAEMPAFAEEVEAACAEGVRLAPLVSPVRILAPGGRLAGVVCVRNRLGARDATGRRSPVPVPGSEHELRLDTLIVAAGEAVDAASLGPLGLDLHEDGRLCVDPETLETSRPGVFAGGDAAGGPGTVVGAIAAGQRAGVVIGRFLRGAPLREAARAVVPTVFIAPGEGEPAAGGRRAEPARLPLASRQGSFAEVELPLRAEDARREARRCLRCDLDFTRPPEAGIPAAAGGAAP